MLPPPTGDPEEKVPELPTGTSASYSIRMQWTSKPITLYSGDITLKKRKEDDPLPRPLMDSEPEGYFGTTSTYTLSDSPGQTVQMYRAKKESGVKPDALLSK